MSDAFRKACREKAATLAVRARWSAALVAVTMATGPLLLSTFGLPLPDGWLLSAAITCGLVALIHSVLLDFDARLFDLMASHDTEPDGGAAVDDMLARMRLKPVPAATRPLADRLAGTWRIERRHALWLVAYALSAGSVLWSAA